MLLQVAMPAPLTAASRMWKGPLHLANLLSHPRICVHILLEGPGPSGFAACLWWSVARVVQPATSDKPHAGHGWGAPNPIQNQIMLALASASPCSTGRYDERWIGSNVRFPPFLFFSEQDVVSSRCQHGRGIVGSGSNPWRCIQTTPNLDRGRIRIPVYPQGGSMANAFPRHVFCLTVPPWSPSRHCTLGRHGVSWRASRPRGPSPLGLDGLRAPRNVVDPGLQRGHPHQPYPNS
jgi:hypothetical protein